MNKQDFVSDEELELHNCLEGTDKVSNEVDTTDFKRRARYQQAIWRENKGLPIGTQPIKPKEGEQSRLLGSRIELNNAKDKLANFLSQNIKKEVQNRLSKPERNQMLYANRLYADCLSSMPMCFNLFGLVSQDLENATAALKHWWPSAPGSVSNVRFEWSPGRAIKGRFLENRSAFDVAFELKLDNGNKGLVGIETKYHEHCKNESTPSQDRINRYRNISEESEVFKLNSIDAILGTDLQQIWQDHLLALSMLQDHTSNWEWVKFVLIYPERNPSFQRAANSYKKHLINSETFEARTVESMLNCPFIRKDELALFKDRYLW